MLYDGTVWSNINKFNLIKLTTLVAKAVYSKLLYHTGVLKTLNTARAEIHLSTASLKFSRKIYFILID
jgi:hypothetical protein